MPSSLLVTSKSCLKMLKEIDHPLISSCKVRLIENMNLSKIPKPYKGAVNAVGGGAVIDRGKLLAGKNRCFVTPTTASGSAFTKHSVIWTKTRKINVKTQLPILINYALPIKLSPIAIERTKTDCFCHIIESFNSKKATKESKSFCKTALEKLLKYHITKDINDLIDAGNWAGRAIEITGTNFLHAISYIFTLDYGLCHGDALKAALEIHKHKDADAIILKAKKKYRKFMDTTLCNIK